MKSNFNETPHFPFTYGDDVTNDSHRLSDYVVNKLSEEKTQNYLVSMVIAMLALGSQATPVNAIPPEYGDAVVNSLKDVTQQPVPGANGIPQGTLQNQVDINQLHQKAAEALGTAGPQVGIPNNVEPPKKPFVPFFPGPPITPGWQTTNSLALLFSVGVICANGAWGNPWAATVCAGALFKAAENLMASLMK